MPEWYYNWNLAMLNFWHAHPTLWATAVCGALAIYVGATLLLRRRR